MPERPTLAQTVDVVIGYAVTGDERYQRAAGRLLGLIGLEHRLTLAETKTVARCFRYLPDDPDTARVVLLSWTKPTKRRSPT